MTPPPPPVLSPCDVDQVKTSPQARKVFMVDREDMVDMVDLGDLVDMVDVDMVYISIVIFI